MIPKCRPCCHLESAVKQTIYAASTVLPSVQGDMEISEIQGRNEVTDLISVYVEEEKNQKNKESETDLVSNEVEIVAAGQHVCAFEIKEIQNSKVTNEKAIGSTDCTQNDTNVSYTVESVLNNVQYIDSTQNDTNVSNAAAPTLDNIQHTESDGITNVSTEPIFLDNLDPDSISIVFQKPSSTTQLVIKNDEQEETNNFDISTVTISNDLLNGININIKKSDSSKSDGGLYTAEWVCDGNNDSDVQLRVLKDTKENVQIPVPVDTGVTAVTKHKNKIIENRSLATQEKTKISRKLKKHVRLKSAARVKKEDEEKLKKKAECMRVKRKKLYEQESGEERLERLSKEAAKRRESRMYYETSDQRRKRLDAEAARKREYRMYNETPEDRRKRLDREAERRRIKRLSLYANETPEKRRDRLDKESAKRREARLNQYAKETKEQRKQRLRRDALRARQMRFTRSTVETEEERRQRLVKDALRKREVRMHGSHSANNNFTELRTVRNFEELNDAQIKDKSENQSDNQYLSNWMVWFQNTLTQPVQNGEQIAEPQAQDNR